MEKPIDRPLHVTVFLDGRPGHEKQTKGILNAMSRLTTIDVADQSVVPGKWGGSVKAWATYLWSKLNPVKPDVQRSDIDLIMGTGAHTHIPMLLLKRSCGAKAVTSMSPAMPLIREFDLCFIPQHDGVNPQNNILVTLGPPNSAVSLGRHQQNRGLILVGGVDHKSHYWKQDELLDRIRLILKKESAIEWTISSSPRTPPDTVQQLDRLVSQERNASFYPSKATPAGWIEEQYALNHRVWVSADSVSMAYEAVTAGCCVGILPVDWKQKTGKIKRSIDYLLVNGWAESFEQWRSGMDMKMPDTRLDEAGRCAREILKRWWPSRLA
jgi:mitochondrial fission protein ELM1